MGPRYTAIALAAGWLLLMALLAVPASKLEFNNDEWLPADHPVELSLDRLAEEFEPGETLLLVLQLREDFFASPQVQERLHHLEEALRDLPLVSETTSAVSGRIVISLPPEDEELYGEELYGDELYDDEPPPPVLEIGSFRYAMQQGALLPTADADAATDLQTYAQAFADSPYAGRLLSADGRLAAIQLRLDTRENHAARTIAVAQVRALTERYWPDTYWTVGAAAIKDELNLRLGEDIIWLLMLALGGTLLLLRLLLGTWARALLIGACAGGCTLAALAWMPLLGVPFTAPGLILPVMIITVAVADSLHLLLRWDRLYPQAPSPRAAAMQTLRALWVPCLSASLTTAIGCGAFISSDILVLAEFSLAAIIGIFTAYPLMLIPLLAALATAPKPFLAPANGGDNRFPGRLWQALLRPAQSWVRHSPKRTALLVLLPCALLAAGLHRLHTESNFLAIFFAADDHIRQGFQLVDNELGGSGSVDVMLDTDTPGHFREQSALQAMTALEEDLRVTHVNRVDSYSLPLRQVHPRLAQDHSAGDLPRNSSELEQEIFFLELSRNEEQRGVLEPYANFTYSGARIDLHTPDLRSAQLAQLIQQIEHQLPPADGDMRATITGFGVFLHRLAELILSTQVTSLIWTLGLISLVFLAQFKVLPALLGIGVNIVPLAATAGLISWLKLPYDFGTVLVIGVTLGFAVDDTLHLLHQHRHNTGATHERLRQSLRVAGPAILTAGLTLAFGLILLLSSDLVLIQRFAAFSVFGVVMSLACTLLLLPALLVLFSGEPAPEPGAENGDQSR